MIIYHRTTPAAAQAVPTHGFMDGVTGYGTECARPGVRFSDVPLDGSAGVRGDALLTIDLVGEDRRSLAVYVWTDPDHRAGDTEWLIPAAFVNARAVIVSVDVREPATW